MPSNNRDTAKLDELLSELEWHYDIAKLELLLRELGGKPEWSCDTAKLDELLSGSKPEWHDALGDSQFGPMALDDIKRRHKADGFPSDALVWRDGFKEGQRIGNVPEFACEPRPLPQQSPSTVEVPKQTAEMAPPTSRGLRAWFRTRIFHK